MKLCPLTSNPCYRSDCEWWVEEAGCVMVARGQGVIHYTAKPHYDQPNKFTKWESGGERVLWWKK